MASLFTFARRHPVATLAGTAAGLSIAYQARFRYLQASASQREILGLQKGFPIASASDASQKGTFEKSGFKTLTLEEARMVNHNVKLLRFKLPDGDVDSGLKPIST